MMNLSCMNREKMHNQSKISLRQLFSDSLPQLNPLRQGKHHLKRGDVLHMFNLWLSVLEFMGEVNSDLLDFKGREEVCLVSLKCNLSSMCFSSVGNMSRLGGVLLLILEGISILVKPKGLPSLYRDDNLLHVKKKRPTKILSPPL